MRLYSKVVCISKLMPKNYIISSAFPTSVNYRYIRKIISFNYYYFVFLRLKKK